MCVIGTVLTGCIITVIRDLLRSRHRTNMFLNMSVAHGMIICAVYICFITLEQYVQKFCHASHYFITGSHHHLHIWNKFLRLTCLTPCFGRCVYVRVLGDDIPMVHAWKQDHCSWTCRSIQTYTHATLWPTVCSALPWWHNPEFYCQCEYKSVYRCVGIIGWVNMSVKALEREA